MIETLIKELSTLAFIKLENRFTWFTAEPGTVKWIIEIEHTSQRGVKFTHVGHDLEEILSLALKDIKSVKRKCGGCDYILPTHSNDCPYYKEPTFCETCGKETNGNEYCSDDCAEYEDLE